MEWISVNDRLPYLDEWQIFLDNTGEVFVGYYGLAGNKIDVTIFNGMGEYYIELPLYITHWMPLPDPPESAG